jgi:GMP synthase (glutamine-hydrolysing)
MQETILIIDFGSQYTQLIARRVRELNVYCEIHPFHKIPAITSDIKGVILSGSPFSVRDSQSPNPDLSAFKGKLPLLGVCYGAQLMAQKFGGEVLPSKHREYGRANLSFVNKENELFKGISDNSQVWMSHADTITKIPDNYEIISSTKDVKFAGYQVKSEQTSG